MPLPNPGMSFTPFDPLAASELNDLVENDQALSNGTGFDTTNSGWAWTSYTPTWTGSSSNPTLGTSTLQGYYRQNGKTVELNVQLIMNTGFTVGSGQYRFALPVAANTSHIATGTFFMCSGYLLDTSASEPGFISGAKLITSTTMEVQGGKAGGFGAVASAFPFAWNNGDVITFGATYEAA